MQTDPAARPGSEDEKSRLRRSSLARRRRRSPDALARAREAISSHLLEHLEGAEQVASFRPLATEPLDPDLGKQLRKAGTRVLLPISSDTGPMDWAVDTGRYRQGPRGIEEPAGKPLGPKTIADVTAVLVPALLADARGVRLGRGGGYYDRTLPGTKAETIVVLFDDELVDLLPADAFDVPVTSIVTPSSGVLRLTGKKR